MLVRDEKTLRIPSSPVRTRRRASEIARLLFKELARHNGVGLAAPQIGIHERVFVLAVPGAATRMAFVNPALVSGKFFMFGREECLSFPGRSWMTWRHAHVVMASDNLGETHGDYLLSLVMQHELSHLDGLLAWDFAGRWEDAGKHEGYHGVLSRMRGAPPA